MCFLRASDVNILFLKFDVSLGKVSLSCFLSILIRVFVKLRPNLRISRVYAYMVNLFI